MMYCMERVAAGKVGMSSFDVLVDSDAFVGWSLTADAHHAHSLQLFEDLFAQHKKLVTTSSVVAETATVLSHYSGQDAARRFLKSIAADTAFPVIFIDEKLHNASLDLFSQQKKKGTSFTDCANVVVMQQFEVAAILSFDKVYSRDFGVEVVR